MYIVNSSCFLICATTVMPPDKISLFMCPEFFTQIQEGEHVFLYLSEVFWKINPRPYGVEKLFEYVEKIPFSTSVCILTDAKHCIKLHDLFKENSKDFCGSEPIVFLRPSKTDFIFEINEASFLNKEKIISFSLLETNAVLLDVFKGFNPN